MILSTYLQKKRGVYMEKIGTITVSVFRNENNQTDFQIQTDNENILPVSYVIEDTLKKY